MKRTSLSLDVEHRDAASRIHNQPHKQRNRYVQDTATLVRRSITT